MKALLTAFALLSFVAASTLPMAAWAEDTQTDHSMDKDGDHAKTDTMSGKTMHSTSKHKSHKTVHKKAKHRKHTAKAKHHKTMDKPAPKDG